MSRKYIGQVNSTNFVYPNNTLHEYDTEIIHDINNNSVNGTISNFRVSSSASSSITFLFDYTWNLNGAEPFINNFGAISVLSVHIMVAGQTYYKPWRTVSNWTTSIGNTTASGTDVGFTITPSEFGLSSFSNGTYYVEFRFIGHRAVFPVCASASVTALPTPTPTPTYTPTPTPTITPTPTPGGNYTSGATINVTDTGWIKYTTSSGDTYQYISSLGTNTLTNCLVCSTIMAGIPFADVANFTVVNCGTACGGGGGPTPTPTPTAVTTYYRLTNCQDYLTYYSQGYPSGTFNSGDRVEGSSGYYYVVSGSQTSNPGGTLYSVTSTGLFGCP
jgi:hypothetical protein